jgi:ABC-type multidrug transport system ATPase subunit
MALARTELRRTMKPIATLQNISFSYDGLDVIRNLSSIISPGLTVVTGDEGSGKTTLLRLLAGELTPTSGSIERPPEVFWVTPRTEEFDQISAAQFFANQQKRFVDFNSALALVLAEALGLAEHLAKPLYMLSSGSKRKVWIAAGFASCAQLTILDDPFGALDKGSRNVVLELLQDAAEHKSRAWVMADYEVPVGLNAATPKSIRCVQALAG